MVYVKINDTLYPASLRMRGQDSEWGGRGSMAITLSMTHAEAAALFVDGLEWQQVYDEEITDRSEYEVAGAITDNRDGTVTVKMGKALASDTGRVLLGENLTMRGAKALRGQMETVFEKAAAAMTADEAISNRALCREWAEGKHTSGEVYKANGQLWQCIQDYDNAIYSDIVPGGSAWGTFHKPYHGSTRETALDWVAPTGAHDMYLTGEYMIWTDGKVYKCLSGTAYSPEEYAGAWEVVE